MRSVSLFVVCLLLAAVISVSLADEMEFARESSDEPVSAAKRRKIQKTNEKAFDKADSKSSKGNEKQFYLRED